MDFSNLEQYNYHEIMENHVVYCISRSHRYADQKKLSMDMLEGEKIILLNTDSVLNRQILEKYNAAKIKPTVCLYSSQLYTTLNFVGRGDCGAFLYSSIAVNPRDFVHLPLDPVAHSHFGIIWKKGSFISQKSAQFIKFIQHYQMVQ
ncbi:MAG TPA: LysR family transcriptional regulator [Oribacterium sp.]|nr:LysR family transcriptional regulator [Oribacterium sp.]